jgi:anti-sigma28 factor (negative regulator of flagellin synthesis)
VEAVQKSAGTQRSARLAQIEQMVRSGSYKPDPAQVAAQILADAEVDAHLSALLSH